MRRKRGREITLAFVNPTMTKVRRQQKKSCVLDLSKLPTNCLLVRSIEWKTKKRGEGRLNNLE